MEIIEALEKKLQTSAKSLVGNKGYRKYLKVTRGSIKIDQEKLKQMIKYDGKWVLRTNTALSSGEVAMKYKELWQVEQIFRDVKSILQTRPIYHKCDETIRGHIFASFLSLVLRKELDSRLEKNGYMFEWKNIKQDLEDLEEVYITDKGKSLKIRTECQGVCGKVFKSVGVALPPTIQQA